MPGTLVLSSRGTSGHTAAPAAAALQLLQQPHCSTAAALGHRVSVSTHSVTAEHSPPWPRTTAEQMQILYIIYISTEAAGTKHHAAVL